MTRLLKTPIIGPWPAIVTSSWIDIEAGLSKKYILRTPPRFLRQRRIASHRKQQPGDEEDVMSRPHVHFLPPKPAKPEPNRDVERTPPSAVRAIFG